MFCHLVIKLMLIVLHKIYFIAIVYLTKCDKMLWSKLFRKVSFPSSISRFFLSPLNLICLFQSSTVLPNVTVRPDNMRALQKEQGLLFLLTELRGTNAPTVPPHFHLLISSNFTFYNANPPPFSWYCSCIVSWARSELYYDGHHSSSRERNMGSSTWMQKYTCCSI